MGVPPLPGLSVSRRHYTVQSPKLSASQSVYFLFLSAWYSESFEEDIDDNFDIVFPERIDKGRTKRDLSTGTKVFNLEVRI